MGGRPGPGRRAVGVGVSGEVTFGPGGGTLLCDGRPVAPLAVAHTAASRRRGLLGSDRVEGALWLTRCPTVHMVGMRYPIDVAVVDRDGRVLCVRTLRPWTGLTRPRWSASATIEAAAGSMATWGIRTGSVLSPGVGSADDPSAGDPSADQTSADPRADPRADPPSTDDTSARPPSARPPSADAPR